MPAWPPWCRSFREAPASADPIAARRRGPWPEMVEDQFTRGCSPSLGIGDVRFLPPRRAADLPAVGPGTRMLCWPSRSWPRPHAARRARGDPARGTLPARGRRHDGLAAARPRPAFGVPIRSSSERCDRAGRATGPGGPFTAIATSFGASASSCSRIQPAGNAARPVPEPRIGRWSWSRSARPICIVSIWQPNCRCCRPARG